MRIAFCLPFGCFVVSTSAAAPSTIDGQHCSRVSGLATGARGQDLLQRDFLALLRIGVAYEADSRFTKPKYPAAGVSKCNSAPGRASRPR